MKKLLLIPALLAAAATTALAQSSLYAQEDLRAECAKSQAEYGGNYAGAAAYPTDYSKDAKGRYVYGDRTYKPCTEAQFAAYLDRADPAKVMAAYPAGAGRPTVKRDTRRETTARDDRRPASPR
jgi:hypothetical protein